MADLEKLKRNLEARGFAVSCFDTAEEAAAYLDAALDQKTVGIGGSVTLDRVLELGLAERLGTHNQVLWHWTGGTSEAAAGAQVYLSSVNGAAETGELITSTAPATGWPPASSATRRSILSSDRTRWPRTTTPPSGGPGTSPPQERPAPGGPDPLRRQGRTAATTARAPSASAGP